MPDANRHRTARVTFILVLVSVFVCLPLAFLLLGHTSSSQDDASLPRRRVRFERRYPTERKIIGPNYHLHKMPDMPIDLKARYDKRRLQVQHGRPRLEARSAALQRFRRSVPSSPPSTTSDPGDYIPLTTASPDLQLNLQCGSCAIVANSGYIRRSSLGREIDDADCVFRMEDAPTRGYERDVGRKTTVRVVSHTSMPDLASATSPAQPSATHLLLHGPAHVRTSRPFQQLLGEFSDAEPDMEMYWMGHGLEERADFELLKHTGKSRHTSSSEFSTDFYALVAARDVCSSITVYGMLPRDFCRDNPGNSVSYRYYKDPTLTACAMNDYHYNTEVGGQRLRAEKQVMEGWRWDEEDIRFVHPAWE